MTFNESLHPRGHGAHGGEWIKKLDSKISKDLGETKAAKPSVILNPSIDQIEVGDKIRPKGWSMSIEVTGKSGNRVHTDQGSIPIERVGKVFPSNKVEAPKGTRVKKELGTIRHMDVALHVPSDKEITAPNEISAIDNYTGGGYEDINGVLRHGPGHKFTYMDLEEADRHTKGLDSVFSKLPPLKRNVEVKRGIVNADAVFGPVGGRIGKIFSDKGYVSTTYHANDRYGSANRSADGKADISIIMPQGSKGFQPAKHGQFGDAEGEVLLPRGSRFKIIKDFMDGNLRRLELELLT